MRSFRRATPAEDSAGWDLIIATNAGEFPVQVKTSKARAAEIKSREIVTVWVRGRSRRQIFDTIIRGVGTLRNERAEA